MTEIALAIRTLVALVFLSAALGKLRNRLAFQGVVANYQLLPESIVPLFTLLLPPLEAIVAATLLFAPTPWPEASAATLLILFAAAIAINLQRGRRHIDCGCFQAAHKQTLSWVLVARNGGLALALALPATLSEHPLSAAGAAEALLTGTVLFVLLQTLNVLWSVVPTWRQPRPVTSGAEK
jgi:hypothetical protein